MVRLMLIDHRPSYPYSISCAGKVHFRRVHALDNRKSSIRINGNVRQTITAGNGHLDKVEPDVSFQRCEARGARVGMKDPYPAYLCEPLLVLYLSSAFAGA
jgi:hypothetical protein